LRPDLSLPYYSATEPITQRRPYLPKVAACCFPATIKLALWAVPILFLLACAPAVRYPEEEALGIDPASVVAALDGQNRLLTSFKGIGRLTLNDGRRLQTYRIAWAGRPPDMLRLEVLHPAGAPVLTFSSDGHTFYLYVYAENRLYKKAATDADLEAFVSLPVRFSDVTAFLSGRVPLRPYSRVDLATGPDGGDYTLTLKKWWGAVVQKIVIGSDLWQPRRMELFDRSQHLQYQAEISDIVEIDGYRIPRKLSFSDGKGRGFDLTVGRFWTDVALSPSIFSLRRPDLS
jgi:outer membrane lipoprotein-sorting protein